MYSFWNDLSPTENPVYTRASQVLIVAVAVACSTSSTVESTPPVVEGRWSFMGRFALSKRVTGIDISADGESLRAIISFSGRQVRATGRRTTDGLSLRTAGERGLTIVGRVVDDSIMVVSITGDALPQVIESRFVRQR